MTTDLVLHFMNLLWFDNNLLFVCGFVGEVGLFLTVSVSDSGSTAPNAVSAKSNHQSTPIIAGVIGVFVALVLVIGLLICFIKRKRTPDHLVDNASGKHSYMYARFFGSLEQFLCFNQLIK